MLPPAYERRGTLDLATNRLAAIAMTAIAAGLVLPVIWVVQRFLASIRPETASFQFTPLMVVEVALLIAVTVIVHEAIHGLCFWFLTRQRPVFGLRGLYAFAGAPGWYFTRGQYAVAALAPLVVITVLGLALVPVAPSPLVLALPFVVAFNAAGSIGDLAGVVWLLTKQPGILVCDSGEAVTVYQPVRLENGSRA